MSGLSVASTVLVLFYHHRNKNIGIKYPDRTPDVHSTRLYRVKRPEKENNNRHNGLSRNGVQPSTERLLADYMEMADSSDNVSYDEKESCWKAMRKTCRSQLANCQCNTRSRTFADNLDRTMFLVVTILTILSTIVAMVLMVYW
jgi:hypothetical protein